MNERLNDAEDQLGSVKKELEAERKKPSKIEYKYSDKCYRCNKYEYDKTIDETRENRIAAIQDRRKAAEELAEAERIHAHHEKAVNERVEEIVKKKTIPERLGAWFDLHWKVNDMLLYLFPILYAVGITVMSICRNEVFRKDFVEALSAVGHTLAAAFNGIKWFICFVAGLTGNIDNAIASKILWWVITVILTALVVAIILAAILFGGRLLIKFFNEHIEVFTCKAFFSMLLGGFGVIVFLGDYIITILPINLMLTYILIIVMYFVVRYGLPVFIPWFLNCIVEFGRGLTNR